MVRAQALRRQCPLRPGDEQLVRRREPLAGGEGPAGVNHDGAEADGLRQGDQRLGDVDRADDDQGRRGDVDFEEHVRAGDGLQTGGRAGEQGGQGREQGIVARSRPVGVGQEVAAPVESGRQAGCLTGGDGFQPPAVYLQQGLDVHFEGAAAGQPHFLERALLDEAVTQAARGCAGEDFLRRLHHRPFDAAAADGAAHPSTGRHRHP